MNHPGKLPLPKPAPPAPSRPAEAEPKPSGADSRQQIESIVMRHVRGWWRDGKLTHEHEPRDVLALVDEIVEKWAAKQEEAE